MDNGGWLHDSGYVEWRSDPEWQPLRGASGKALYNVDYFLHNQCDLSFVYDKDCCLLRYDDPLFCV